jgi:phosphomannomutase
MAQKTKDPTLISSIIASPTIEKAAEAVEVSSRTISRRMNDQDFRDALYEAQNQILCTTISYMTDLLIKAAMKLEALLESKSERIQVQAAKLILQIGPTLRRNFEFEERLRVLENEKILRINLPEVENVQDDGKTS